MQTWQKLPILRASPCDSPWTAPWRSSSSASSTKPDCDTQLGQIASKLQALGTRWTTGMGLSTGDFSRFEMPIWNELEATATEALGAGKFNIPADRHVRRMHGRMEEYMAALSKEAETEPRIWDPPNLTLSMPGQQQQQQQQQQPGDKQALDYAECLPLTPDKMKERLAYGSISQEHLDATMLRLTELDAARYDTSQDGKAQEAVSKRLSDERDEIFKLCGSTLEEYYKQRELLRQEVQRAAETIALAGGDVSAAYREVRTGKFGPVSTPRPVAAATTAAVAAAIATPTAVPVPRPPQPIGPGFAPAEQATSVFDLTGSDRRDVDMTFTEPIALPSSTTPSIVEIEMKTVQQPVLVPSAVPSGEPPQLPLVAGVPSSSLLSSPVQITPVVSQVPASAAPAVAAIVAAPQPPQPQLTPQQAQAQDEARFVAKINEASGELKEANAEFNRLIALINTEAGLHNKRVTAGEKGKAVDNKVWTQREAYAKFAAATASDYEKLNRADATRLLKRMELGIEYDKPQSAVQIRPQNPVAQLSGPGHDQFVKYLNVMRNFTRAATTARNARAAYKTATDARKTAIDAAIGQPAKEKAKADHKQNVAEAKGAFDNAKKAVTKLEYDTKVRSEADAKFIGIPIDPDTPKKPKQTKKKQSSIFDAPPAPALAPTEQKEKEEKKG